MIARVELDTSETTFASGVLLTLLSALRESSPGDLIALTSLNGANLDADLDAWSRLTGHAIVARTSGDTRTRWVIRHGAAPMGDADLLPLGHRLWVYVNFHCNLHCDYCCVRSSPTARRRELDLAVVRHIAREAPAVGVRELFVTGGEPFLRDDIADVINVLADAAPITLLTNGMLFRGRRLDALKRMPTSRVTLQISLDSPGPALHDMHRGSGSWLRAVDGIDIARVEGFRVRLAATVASDADEDAFRAFLDARQIAPEDRVIRRVALRGAAVSGIALSRADLVPEITITADGVYWHPVGADDADMFVTAEPLPLSNAFDAVRAHVARERAHADRLASVFHCA